MKKVIDSFNHFKTTVNYFQPILKQQETMSNLKSFISLVKRYSEVIKISQRKTVLKQLFRLNLSLFLISQISAPLNRFC